MKRASFLMFAMIVGLFASLAVAQPPHNGPRPRDQQGERMSKLPFDELGLTDEQKAQIHAILSNTRKQNIDISAKLKLAQIELHELIQADSPEQSKIDAKISEVSQLREKRMRSHIESRLAVQKILTPEQRKKARELRPQKREGFRDFEGRGMRQRGGFGPGDEMDTPETEDEL